FGPIILEGKAPKSGAQPDNYSGRYRRGKAAASSQAAKPSRGQLNNFSGKAHDFDGETPS
ncbi:MAG: hypothetical protein ACRD8U_10110, partial [Pyrinomonadaceae bacterium]